MGSVPEYENLPTFPLSDSYKVVAPFASDINTNYGGSVIYTDFSQFTSYSSEIESVNSFINSHISEFEDYFLGTRMMVAEWRDVHKFQEIVSYI